GRRRRGRGSPTRYWRSTPGADRVSGEVVTIDIQQILLTVGGVLFVGVALWLWFQQEKRTYEKKKREAEKNGWTYQRFGKGLRRKYRHLPIVDGDSVRAKHVMRGQYRGRPITMFTLAFR